MTLPAALHRAVDAYVQLLGSTDRQTASSALHEAVADLLLEGWRLEVVVLGRTQHAHLTKPEVADPVALGLAYVLCGVDPGDARVAMSDYEGVEFPDENSGHDVCDSCLRIGTVAS